MNNVISINTPVRFPSESLAQSNRRRKRAIANSGPRQGNLPDLMANINYYNEHGKLPESADMQRHRRRSS